MTGFSRTPGRRKGGALALTLVSLIAVGCSAQTGAAPPTPTHGMTMGGHGTGGTTVGSQSAGTTPGGVDLAGAGNPALDPTAGVAEGGQPLTYTLAGAVKVFELTT